MSHISGSVNVDELRISKVVESEKTRFKYGEDSDSDECEDVLVDESSPRFDEAPLRMSTAGQTGY